MPRSSKSQTPWWVIDCETDPFQHGDVPEDFAWGAFNGTDYLSWWNDGDGFTAWLAGTDARFYAHNGGKFDVHLLLSRKAAHFHGKALVMNGRLVCVRYGKAEIRDSWAILPVPLARFAKTEIDYRKLRKTRRERHRAEIAAYLESDCRNLHAAISAFHREHPGFPMTLAGAAFRRACQLTDVETPKGKEAWDSRFRPFYYGGRCEARRKGILRGPWDIYDINSAYPRAMQEAHGFGFECEHTDELPTFHFEQSMIELDGVSRGALPHRKEDRSLWFPMDGEVRTYFATGWEVKAALETDSLEIHRVRNSWTPRALHGFAPFVAHFWEKKAAASAAGNKAEREIAKLFLNSAYGKLGQDPREFQEFRFMEPREYRYDPNAVVIEIEGKLLVGVPAPGKRFYNVLTAASITGAVRATLWLAIHQATRNGGEIIYCDTDSLIGRGIQVTEGDAIGQWKHEGRYKSIAIAGKKLYAADLHDETQSCKIASKGVRLTREEIRRVARGESVTWRSPAPTYKLDRDPVFLSRTVRGT